MYPLKSCSRISLPLTGNLNRRSGIPGDISRVKLLNQTEVTVNSPKPDYVKRRVERFMKFINNLFSGQVFISDSKAGYDLHGVYRIYGEEIPYTGGVIKESSFLKERTLFKDGKPYAKLTKTKDGSFSFDMCPTTVSYDAGKNEFSIYRAMNKQEEGVSKPRLHGYWEKVFHPEGGEKGHFVEISRF